jgi:hypothetical protein
MARTEVTGTQIKDGSVDLTVDVTGILTVSNGGTGSNTLALNNVLLGNGTGALQAVAPGASGNVLTSNGTTWVSSAPNKPRVGTTASSATPSIDCGLYDQYTITALAAAITGVTITGTPTDGQKLLVRIKDNGTARAITWGASFSSSGVATLLATTVASKSHMVGLIYDSAATKWVCAAVDATGY